MSGTAAGGGDLNGSGMAAVIKIGPLHFGQFLVWPANSSLALSLLLQVGQTMRITMWTSPSN